MVILRLRFAVVSFALLFSASLPQLSYAQQLKETKPARDGIYSFIEFNPADLQWGRYRLAHENLILESLSFALSGEVQERRNKGEFSEQSLTAGLGLQYYPQSVTLQGGFIRAETNLAVSGLSHAEASRFHVAALKVAGDLGWRVRLSDRLTGSAAYGIRTTLPQVIWTNDTLGSQRWMREGETADVRVQINLGLLL